MQEKNEMTQTRVSSGGVVETGKRARKVGRPERTEPYKITELPTNITDVSKTEVNRIKRQRAIDFNNVRSQKYRQKKTQECRNTEEEAGRLEKRKQAMTRLELARMEKIRMIKQFYKKKIEVKCDLCTQVLHTVVSQSSPMVIIKEECMIDLESIKTETP